MDLKKFYSTYFLPGNVSTDSRAIEEGGIFIALRGEKFNGNEYAKTALDAGARIVVIDDPVYKEHENMILVKDCLMFLQELAAYHRQKCRGHFIGLTGTNGKTTTKELILTVLSGKYTCHANKGNFNNHIGVPLTILSVQPETEIVIIEMGANHIGEIENLCSISKPDSGLITNIGKAHLEGFGNLEGVKKAKNELYIYLKHKGGKVYINGSDNILVSLLGNYAHIESYNTPSGLCTGEIIESENQLKLAISHQNDKVIVDTNLYGSYNFSNILAAACIGIDFDMNLNDIKSRLENYYPANQRSQLLSFGTTRIILDCYNANPTSMKEAIDSFLKMPSKKKIVVLGEMKELGEYSRAEHETIGALLKDAALDHTFLIGKEFANVKFDNATNLADVEELREYLSEMDLQNTSILVKGSRANKLERIQQFFETN